MSEYGGGHEPERTRPWWVWPVVVIVAAPIAGFGIGLDVPHALLLGLALGIATLAARALPLGEWAMWPRLPFERSDGARREVSALSWTLYTRRGEISGTGRTRLREVALAALDHGGIDLTSPAGRAEADRLLGAGLVAFLLDPNAPAPDSRGVSRCLTALETLDLRRGTP